MDKIEGISFCTVSICCAVVLIVLAIVGADCTKHSDAKKAEVRKSAIERDGEITIKADWP